ncbi:hypothetical protein L7F22_002120, partial [Adiantum nelumboides]|nr:hypothetical protein [Adiantum nelumboides]
TAAITGERKKKEGKGPNNDDVPPLAVVELEPCKPVAVTKEGKKGYLKSQQPEQGLKRAMPLKIDAPLSVDVPRESCQGEQDKGQGYVKEKEGTVFPEQQNVKRLKRMKEVEVCEAIERKLAVDEVKVKGQTGKGQLEKVSEVKIALKRDGLKNNAKKLVEKGQEDEGLVDKALALVGSSKRPKLQVKRAKQSGASCTTSTTMVRSP